MEVIFSRECLLFDGSIDEFFTQDLTNAWCVWQCHWWFLIVPTPTVTRNVFHKVKSKKSNNFPYYSQVLGDTCLWQTSWGSMRCQGWVFHQASAITTRWQNNQNTFESLPCYGLAIGERSMNILQYVQQYPIENAKMKISFWTYLNND